MDVDQLQGNWEYLTFVFDGATQTAQAVAGLPKLAIVASTFLIRAGELTLHGDILLGSANGI
jgi:hypothetical protein